MDLGKTINLQTPVLEWLVNGVHEDRVPRQVVSALVTSNSKRALVTIKGNIKDFINKVILISDGIISPADDFPDRKPQNVKVNKATIKRDLEEYIKRSNDESSNTTLFRLKKVYYKGNDIFIEAEYPTLAHQPEEYFVLSVSTVGISNTMLTLPILGIADELEIDWGDGEVEKVSNDFPSHTYSANSDFTIKILGKFTTFDNYNEGGYGDSDMMFKAVVQLGHSEMDIINFGAADELTHFITKPTDRIGNFVSMENMFAHCDSLTTVDLSNIDLSNVVNVKSAFLSCYELNSLLFNTANTVAPTDMSRMFHNCRELPGTLDLSNWDLSNVTSMRDAFSRCSLLEGVVFNPNTSTQSLVDLSFAFYSTGIENLDLTMFDLENVTTMDSAFKTNYSLLSLVFKPTTNTSSLTSAPSIFESTSRLTHLDVSMFDFSKLRFLRYAFYGQTHMEYLDLGDNAHAPLCEDLYSTFRSFGSFTSSGNGGVINGIDNLLSNMSTNPGSLNAYFAFAEAHIKDSLDLSNWDLSRFSNIEGFFNTAVIPVLDITGWEITPNTSNHYAPFNNATIGQIIGIDTLVTSNSVDIHNLMSYYNASNFLDLSGWDTSNVTRMEELFSHSTITDFNGAGWDVSSCTNFSRMFNGSYSLTAEAYTAILDNTTGWTRNTILPPSGVVEFGMNTAKYYDSSEVIAGRDAIETAGYTVIDGGPYACGDHLSRIVGNGFAYSPYTFDPFGGGFLNDANNDLRVEIDVLKVTSPGVVWAIGGDLDTDDYMYIELVNGDVAGNYKIHFVIEYKDQGKIEETTTSDITFVQNPGSNPVLALRLLFYANGDITYYLSYGGNTISTVNKPNWNVAGDFVMSGKEHRIFVGSPGIGDLENTPSVTCDAAFMYLRLNGDTYADVADISTGECRHCDNFTVNNINHTPYCYS